MKKNLAKRIVLGLLTGAVLMSNSVAWAADNLTIGTHTGDKSILITMNGGHAYMANSIFIGNNGGVGQMNGNVTTPDSGKNGVAIGEKAKVIADGGVALGADTTVSKEGSVALGYGSVASEENVVSVGSGDATIAGVPATRKIVNVTKGELDTDAATYGQVQEVSVAVDAVNNKIGNVNFAGTGVIQSATTTLSGAISEVSAMVEYNNGEIDKIDGIVGVGLENETQLKLLRNSYSLTESVLRLDSCVYNNKQAIEGIINNGTITVNAGSQKNPVTIDTDGITIGTNSTRMDSTGFYAGRIQTGPNDPHNYANAQAAITEDGKIKGAGGKFEVGTDGSVKAADGAFKVDDNGNVTGGTYNGVDIQALANSVASNDAVAGLNQRLEKTNAKINKVGAGAAALAALHPLDYDPDDKLTFSAGMGNYAGENAAALGAFYRPNEKFMLSLGGTMGNGENMVNLGLSIGLDKASGFAKMSKRELIQEVNAVKAENEALKDQLANADERIAKLEALVAQLVAK